MKQLVYDPTKSGGEMVIVCFVSGSGTNYREIVAQNRNHKYVVFTNRPDCAGVAIARKNKHEVIELSHLSYLRGVRKRYGSRNVPRNCPERIKYEQKICQLIEESVDGEPDLICLAGYDQWLTDWMVDKYCPRILNVHPGDTVKGFNGLHWLPVAKAILAGEKSIRSTLFLVDKGEDTGAVLVQSKPLNIAQTVAKLDDKGTKGLAEKLTEVTSFATINKITTFRDYKERAGVRLLETMRDISNNLQDALKVAGDWKIYPFAVDKLIAQGRVEIADRTVYIDGKEMPEYGYRIDEYE